ncbi:MAG: 2-oxo-4-hydroxy-4-carboxy-5-ureidoimidazoline decarboxylase [Streptosporangiaceae bacterium]|jgi:2-oxo-4-hydroxy-4-carboxy-5-ureidoimidazoline decarboxylase
MTPGVAVFDADVRAAVEAAYAKLTWDDIAAVVAAHPRIGEHSTTGEQAGVTDDTRPELTAANRAYEERFGHIFLTCAQGRSGQEMLAELRQRLNNDDESERRVVTAELLKIALLRAGRLLA